MEQNQTNSSQENNNRRTLVEPINSNPIKDIYIERVQQIILTRKRRVKQGGVVFFVILFISAFSNNNPIQAVAIITILFTIFFAVFYAVEAANYPQPKPYYRQWNKIIYIYLSKIIIIISIFRIVTNIIGILNPLHGFGHPGAPSKPELLLDTTMSAVIGNVLHKNLKPAAFIEECYRQQDVYQKKVQYLP